jgi:hypothetical protein
MATIEIKFVILNPHEIVGKEKGKLADLFSKWFMDEEKVRREVEKGVTAELIKELEIKIPAALAERGVRAELHFSVSEPKDAL